MTIITILLTNTSSIRVTSSADASPPLHAILQNRNRLGLLSQKQGLGLTVSPSDEINKINEKRQFDVFAFLFLPDVKVPLGLLAPLCWNKVSLL